MDAGTIDLDQLELRSGQARTTELVVSPEPPVTGGVSYPLEEAGVTTRVDVSRTTSGYALRLRSWAVATGPCVRCTEQARIRLEVDLREVQQDDASDPELTSPYVSDGVLDVAAWLGDGLTLTMPTKVLCREDCKGICDVCGVSLNDVDPSEHSHERPLDPRFAALRELRVEENG